MTMRPELEEYVEAASWLFGEVGPEDGYPEDEIAGVERRLGVRLPSLLRGVYLRTGRRDDLHQAQNRLRALDGLAIENEALVFLDENQGGAFWCVPVASLSDEDPPVVLWPGGDSPWEQFDHLNAFLHARLFWVRMERSPWVTKRQASANLLSAIEGRWPALTVPPGRSDTGRSEEGRVRWFGGEGELALVLGEAPAATAQLASHDADVLRRLGDELDLLWSEADWSGPEDS